MNLVQSAAQEQPWSRALRLGWERYGSTPIHDQLVAEFAEPPKPVKKAAKKTPRRSSERAGAVG